MVLIALGDRANAKNELQTALRLNLPVEEAQLAKQEIAKLN